MFLSIITVWKNSSICHLENKIGILLLLFSNEKRKRFDFSGVAVASGHGLPLQSSYTSNTLTELLMQRKNLFLLFKLIQDWGNCSQFHPNCCAGGETALTPGGTCLLYCVQPAHTAKGLGWILSWRGAARLCGGAGGRRGRLTSYYYFAC